MYPQLPFRFPLIMNSLSTDRRLPLLRILEEIYPDRKIQSLARHLSPDKSATFEHIFRISSHIHIRHINNITHAFNIHFLNVFLETVSHRNSLNWYHQYFFNRDKSIVVFMHVRYSIK